VLGRPRAGRSAGRCGHHRRKPRAVRQANFLTPPARTPASEAGGPRSSSVAGGLPAEAAGRIAGAFARIRT